MAKHIRNINGRRVYRRRLPIALARRLGRTEIVRALPPCDRAGAEHAVRRLDLIVDRLGLTMKQHPDLGRAELERLALAWFSAELAAVERHLAGMAFPGERDHVSAIAASAERIESASAMVRDGDFPVALETADHILSEAGLLVDAGTRKAMAGLVLRGWAELQRARHDRLAAYPGPYGGNWHDPLFHAAPPPTALAVSTILDPAGGKPVPPAAQKLSDAVQDFATDRGRSGRWRKKSDSQNRAAYCRFIEWAGDRPIDQYTRADLADFISAYSQLPADHGRIPAYRGLDFRAILAEGKKRAATPVAPKTITRNVGALSTLFGWLKRQGRIKENPVTGIHEAQRTRRARYDRPGWSVSDLGWLFKTPAWTGYEKKSRRDVPGSELDRDFFFWLPLILLFSGLRLEEAASLRLDDIREAAGVTYFSINEDHGRRLKSAAATRRLPVHRELVTLGLLDHVERLRKARGETQLFPNLRRTGSDGRFGARMTSDFSDYLKKLGKPRGRGSLGLHGFRGTFRTALTEGSVSAEIANDVMGHEHDGMAKSYNNDLGMLTLAEAVAKVSFPGLDLAHLRPGASRRG